MNYEELKVVSDSPDMRWQHRGCMDFMSKTVRGIALAVLAVALTACGNPQLVGHDETKTSTFGPNSHLSQTENSGSADSGNSNSGSSNSGSSDSGSSDSNATYPKCDDLWKIGKRLPSSYDGTCSTATTTENDGGYECADGSRVWLFDAGSQKLYALPGRAISTMSNQDWVNYLVGTCKPK